MSTKELLLHESETLPEALLQEVLDFALFLRATRLPSPKQEEDTDDAELWGKVDLSKTSWGKNWDNAVEDEVWRDL